MYCILKHTEVYSFHCTSTAGIRMQSLIYNLVPVTLNIQVTGFDLNELKFFHRQKNVPEVLQGICLLLTKANQE